jgi:hypothetical protein
MRVSRLVLSLSTALLCATGLTTSATLAGFTTHISRIWTLDADKQLHVDVTTAVNTPEARNVQAVYRKK